MAVDAPVLIITAAPRGRSPPHRIGPAIHGTTFHLRRGLGNRADADRHGVGGGPRHNRTSNRHA